MKIWIFTNIDLEFNEGKPRGFPFDFYYISLFLSPKSVSAVHSYGDETDIRRFCAFSSIPSWDAEKVKWKNKNALNPFVDSMRFLMKILKKLCVCRAFEWPKARQKSSKDFPSLENLPASSRFALCKQSSPSDANIASELSCYSLSLATGSKR